MDIQQPMIVIGAGRSGTTLLGRILDGHPALDIKGETSFLTSRLWLEAWVDRFWFNWRGYNDADPASSCEPMPPIDPDHLATTRDQIGRHLAEFVASVLEVDRKARFWGFKEIWNGAAGHDHDWAHYDAVFPCAHWIHIVRDPFAFARSCARWSCQPMTVDFLQGQLDVWVAMLRCNGERERTGRYVELRYEELSADPKAATQSLFEALDIAWDDACLGALGSRLVSSTADVETGGTRRLEAGELKRMCAGIDGFMAMLAKFGYSLPTALTVDLPPATASEGPPFCNLRLPYGEAAPKNEPRWALEARILQLERELIATKQQRRTIIERGKATETSSKLWRRFFS